MARYIDADKTLEQLPNDLPYKGSVKRVLMQAPEADVIPKNEVEKYVQIDKYIFETITEGCDYETAEAYERAYNKELSKLADSITTKSEVAREIFEEVEKEVLLSLPVSSYIDAPRTTQNKIWNTIAELKKKYTE